MSRTIFVSYSHEQGDWVWNRLVSCLKGGGAEVLIDREQVEAARRLYKQLDDVQDRAALNILVFSPDYLDSRFCQHEMRRALRRDPKFDPGIAIPVKRVECELPPAIKRSNPLCVDLRDDQDANQWDLLLKKCDADLGTTAPEWLRVRDELRRHLGRGESVNLIVGAGVRWRPLIEDLRRDSSLAELGIVDLEDPVTASRPGLVGAILQACGVTGVSVPAKPNDLVELGRVLTSHRTARVALIKFDLAAHRPEYELDLFAALRYLTMESRKLVLLVQSRIPFAALLPHDHPLSSINLTTVELRGRP
ncbi:MAG: toll/interleukin-1 receptor domain-containing protein [Planctomycetaceae bacterium]|nr:toll/interleukin-1 receptor domain-containing protein [Planctomycetaceae bacterium]MBV8267768.1 toll/interleukin-1 receptor domain-containing protein [Planctomycetaceae bacterium]MBV8317235.1 toll/interleukin-1 receptor domain-containing protein [Planctomycetaceae bacterium]MBV8557004.1 toll/interleukin-1 receptor domain-containing protein [Planctomycetaceae bacterium]MBV8611359.1 toll/interleukin-1 receptor domain-containing protein [Singulisphaera sp.]